MATWKRTRWEERTDANFWLLCQYTARWGGLQYSEGGVANAEAARELAQLLLELPSVRAAHQVDRLRHLLLHGGGLL